MASRAEALGFAPQKEIVYNKFLPYVDKLDDESNEILAQIKGTLPKAVQLHDIKVASNGWATHLSNYIRVYGLKFSKEDHLLFIKLLFEMTTLPGLEMGLVQHFASLTVSLLKKKHLLSREDLVLPWRPLYDLVESVMYNKHEQHGLVLMPQNIDQALKNLVRNCRVYFSVESTAEMLEEWRPLLCPFDITVIKALNYLELFLPTSLPPEQHDQGFKLWLPELLDLWQSFHNAPSWEFSLVSLFSRLAEDCIGYVDWEPYLPQIFTRLLRSFNLPVGTQTIQVRGNNTVYDIGLSSIWIVSMLGNGSSAQAHLDKLFQGLASFYHPSNIGRWNLKLGQLLLNLPKHFVKRLHRERYMKKPTWRPPIPDSHKLKDEEVTQFVNCIKPVIFVAMFSKSGSQEAAIALRSLSNMRPELVIPPLLERMYPAMETLIEPHRLISCMNCIVAVARPMLTSRRWFPEGPSHVLPLLRLALPGIDPNDFKKCLVTFQMISTFVTMVPLVDCSDAVHVRDDLSEMDRELCSSTAQFEDFVLQLLDRIFNLIESSSQESGCGAQDRLTAEQTMLEVGMASTVTSVLQQCSAPIYKSALQRLYSFISNSMFEVKVSGRFAANLCRAASKVNAEEALKMFVPHFCANIEAYIRDHGDIDNEEQLDNSFLWNLLMLSQVVRCNGQQLLQYREKLLSVVQQTMNLRCVQGYEMVGQMVSCLLRPLTMTYPLEYRSIPGSFDRPVDEYLVIRDWAIAGNMDNLDVKWHEPSEAELQFASQILTAVLQPQLTALRSVATDRQIPREELLRRLTLVLECVLGCGSVLPPLGGEQVDLVETLVERSGFQVDITNSSGHPGLTLNGRNLREEVAQAVKHLLSHMHESDADDTKGLFKIVRIYETLLFFHGVQRNEWDGRWKSFHLVKSALADQMRGNKMHIRALLVDRALIQHELRLLNRGPKIFNTQHQEIVKDLFQLSLSHYSEVRKKAQGALGQAFRNFVYCYKCLEPQIIQNLLNPNISDHHFKGTLYTILGSNNKCLAIKRRWETLHALWPALIQAQYSEKPSILKVIDEILNKIVKHVETISIKIEMTQPCLQAAANVLASSSLPKPAGTAATDADLKTGEEHLASHNTASDQYYISLVEEIVGLVDSGKLTWKFHQVGMELLVLLLRYDRAMPPSATRLFVKSMLHEVLYIRKLSMAAVSAILQQQKRQHKTRMVDPIALSGLPPQQVPQALAPGDRADNAWHQYDSQNFPDTREKWLNACFVEKTHWGYYNWPQSLEVHCPSTEQPGFRTREEMSEAEQAIFDSFTSPTFVENLVNNLSLEENKGKDKFHIKRMVMFKGLFRNFGQVAFEPFKPHIERLIADVSFEKHDCSHRCAMEILGGVIRGSKHWDFDQIQALWTWFLPLLRKAMSNMTVETVDDWGTFFTLLSESRDPRKLHWMFEVLLLNPLSGEGGAFGDASRLLVLQNALVQQEWRVPQVLHRLVDYLRPHLAHPYKKVRDRIGSFLSNVYLYDYQVNSRSETRGPRRQELMSLVMPMLEQLKDIVPETEAEKNGEGSNGEENGADAMETESEVGGSEERKRAIRLFKTVLKWTINSHGRCFFAAPPEIFPLLPIICTLESETKDTDLKADCTMALMCIAHSLLHPDSVSIALQTVKEIAGLQSWHAREAVLRYLQHMVFSNYFLLDQPQHHHFIRDLLLHFLCDEQLEVREMASVTLSGLIQCGFLSVDEPLLNHFRRLSQTKLRDRRQQGEAVSAESLLSRHAGVLGFSAAIQAFPYDVPDFIPQLLMDLSCHAHDPQPILGTVKKTLTNFRRTHHDNWYDHKRMFTDDQLVVLTDLLVSPTYYA